MAADLHIHVLKGDEYVVKRFNSSTLGNKWFNHVPYSEHSRHFHDDYDLIASWPDVWVGEVSWLKGALLNDYDSFVPQAVLAVYEAIGCDFPVLDDELKGKILAAMGAGNDTGYSLASIDSVAEFLDEHMGERLFTISW